MRRHRVGNYAGQPPGFRPARQFSRTYSRLSPLGFGAVRRVVRLVDRTRLLTASSKAVSHFGTTMQRSWEAYFDLRFRPQSPQLWHPSFITTDALLILFLAFLNGLNGSLDVIFLFHCGFDEPHRLFSGEHDGEPMVWQLPSDASPLHQKRH